LTNPTNGNSGQLNSFSLSNSKTTTWKFIGKLNANVTPLMPLNQNAALVSQKRNSFFLAGNGLSNVKIPSNNYSKTLQVDGQSVSIGYSSQNSALIVNELNNNELNSTNQQAAIYQQLRIDRYNPYLINIMISVNAI
jgi:hypothetical protein